MSDGAPPGYESGARSVEQDKAPGQVSFSDLTIGIEEEYQIIDPATRDLRSFITQFLEDGKMTLLELIKPELHQSIVEVGTPVCHNVQEARGELVRLRATIHDLAGRNGLH